MSRSKYLILAAVVMGILVGTVQAAPADGARTEITLRIGGYDPPIQATALAGEPIRLHDRDCGITLELVPMLQPVPPGAPPRVALETYEVVTIGREERTNLVYSAELDTEGSTLVFGGDRPFEVELVEIRHVELAPIAAPDSDGLRPTQCCIGCPGGPIVCGFCVELPCGRCCLF